MASIKGRFEYPDDLTPGKTKDGGLHQNLYDSEGRLTDHGTFFPDDEDGTDSLTDPPPVFVYVTHEQPAKSRAEELQELAEAITALIEVSVVIGRVAVKATPYVKRWWNDQARPSITSQWNRLARVRATEDRPATADVSTDLEATVVSSSQEVVAAVDGHRVSMSNAEARARLLLALVAKNFSEEQVRIVSDAHIEDDDGSIEMTRAAQELAANITKMLEANPSFLDDETLIELRQILGGNEETRKILHLTRSDEPAGPEQN